MKKINRYLCWIKISLCFLKKTNNKKVENKVEMCEWDMGEW